MPIGKVKWFEPRKGFGYVTGEDGKDVFLHASALPEGVSTLRPGTKIDYSFADSRRGPQVLSLEVLAEPADTRGPRRKPEEMVPLVEDLIKLLDQTSEPLRRGRYPENGRKLAKLLRALAHEFDA
ncbi:cold-shock protein [Boudabousia tangfeifanii]|uniref:Cold-shock protein n=1 Tax=Boudabousia tangfeifanii TaxID=1912795 RepID=A0A1D9MKY6_9ACTO|nr:cold shock domain-containing protein [Boudabousia tangfeifanii]AOZ72974.1 cold-shock protein [Boudabousia tangfeifanii]